MGPPNTDFTLPREWTMSRYELQGLATFAASRIFGRMCLRLVLAVAYATKDKVLHGGSNPRPGKSSQGWYLCICGWSDAFCAHKRGSQPEPEREGEADLTTLPREGVVSRVICKPDRVQPCDLQAKSVWPSKFLTNPVYAIRLLLKVPSILLVQLPSSSVLPVSHVTAMSIARWFSAFRFIRNVPFRTSPFPSLGQLCIASNHKVHCFQ